METKDCPCPPAAVFTIYAIVFRLTGTIIYAGFTTRRDVKKRIEEHGRNWEHPLYQTYFQAGLSPRWDMDHIIVKEIPFYGTTGTREHKEWLDSCKKQEKKYIQFLIRSQKNPVYNLDYNKSGFWWDAHHGGKGISPKESYYIRDNGKVKRLNNPSPHIMGLIYDLIQASVNQEFQKASHEDKKCLPQNDWKIGRIQDKMKKGWLNAPRAVICKEWTRQVKEYHESLRVSETKAA